LFGKLRKILLSIHAAVSVYRTNRRPIYKNLLWAAALQLNVIAHWFLIGLAMGPSLALRENLLYYVYNYMIIVPAMTLVLMIPVTPGGFGVREWTVWAFRAPLGFAAGAGRDTAALMGWLQVATVLFYGIVGFLMFLFRLFRVRRSGPQQVVPGEAVPPPLP
jgi:glycosyltransferase 2 family protein